MGETGSELRGRVALVTGAGGEGNIGAYTARFLAQAGARVVLADLASSKLEQTAAHVRPYFGRVHA